MGDQAEAAKILGKLNALKEQRQTIVSKIAELDGEHTEHNLVINTLEPLPSDRRCFRMIGEVLVERTNAEVLKAVIENRDNVRAHERAHMHTRMCLRTAHLYHAESHRAPRLTAATARARRDRS